jgi:hypothetical protein
MKQGELSFSVNDKPRQMAFKSAELQRDKLYPALSLLDDNGAVRIIT